MFCPPVDPLLLDYLDNLFQDRCAISPSQSLPELMFAGGQRSVVNHLKHQYQLQQQELSANRVSSA